MDDAAWLPNARDVTAIRAHRRESAPSGEVVWRELILPESVIPELLECLAHREKPNYPKTPRPVLVNYDLRPRIQIELVVSHRRNPVSLGLIKSRLAWIGSRLMVIPPDDAARLGELMFEPRFTADSDRP